MSPTIPQILNFNAATLDEAAAAFTALAGKVDERCDEFVKELRGVEDAWQVGDAREAALAHGTGLRKELELVYPPLVGVGQVLSDHAGEVRVIAHRLRAALAKAKSMHMEVDDDGTVTPPMGPVSQAQADALGKERDGLVTEIGDLLRAATGLDAETARRLAAHRVPGAAGSNGSRGQYPRSSVPAKGTDPRAVESWWNGLTAEERRYVTAMYPDLVGNLDGVPVDARDQANRITLDVQRDRFEDRQRALTDRERYIKDMADQGRLGEVYPDSGNPLGSAYSELDRIADERKANADKLGGINDIDHRVNDQGPGRDRAYLIGFSAEGNGRSIVAVGNPDTADNVLTYVPGTGSHLGANLGGDLNRADVMARDAASWAPGEETAVITWTGYDAPQSIAKDAPREVYAVDGAPDLRRFQDGLRVTHDGPPAQHTVLGHSYGTTVVGYAARDAPLNADNIVLVASPGAGVSHANDLNLTNYGSTEGRVYATTAEHDVIQAARDPWSLAPALTGLPGALYTGYELFNNEHYGHGTNPNHEDFGAVRFTSAPGGTPTDAHSQYWDRDNPARTNIAKIVTGDGQAVQRP